MERTKDELSRLLSHVTVQDILLGILCISKEHKMNSNRCSMMIALHKRCIHPEIIPERFKELFEVLRNGDRDHRFFDGGITMWSDYVESSMGFLTLCDGVIWGCLGNQGYYTIDAKNAEHYLEKYFPSMPAEERAFLEELSREVNGEVVEEVWHH